MSSNEQVVEALSRLLADTYTLYLKTHNYHWNVTGPMFSTLHTLFETEYTEYALAVDEIAERIRAIGARAPGSYTEFAELASVKEDRGSPPRRSGSHGGVGAQDRGGGRSGWRPGDGRPGGAPHRDPREERLDAAKSSGVGSQCLRSKRSPSVGP
jgi:hypothetical protein